jgi:hypothetical protein
MFVSDLGRSAQKMNRNAILVLVLGVLLVSFFFVSRQTAIIRANKLMTPAIENGWSNYKTRLTLVPKGGLVPVWWVRYELENSFTNPLAVYVDFRGEVDDWEVRRMLARYKAAEQAESLKP